MEACKGGGLATIDASIGVLCGHGTSNLEIFQACAARRNESLSTTILLYSRYVLSAVTFSSSAGQAQHPAREYRTPGARRDHQRGVRDFLERRRRYGWREEKATQSIFCGRDGAHTVPKLEVGCRGEITTTGRAQFYTIVIIEGAFGTDIKDGRIKHARGDSSRLYALCRCCASTSFLRRYFRRRHLQLAFLQLLTRAVFVGTTTVPCITHRLSRPS